MKKFILTLLLLMLLGPLGVLVSGKVSLNGSWRTANRDSTHIAPKPATNPEAVIQIYAARAFNWRGMFAVHTWIAVKPKNAKQYTVYQVVGWNKYRKKPVLVIMKDMPDRRWFNQKPWVIFQLKGKQAEIVIPKIDKVARSYPYTHTYYVWPGPNSNTFVAYVARRVPELHFIMPALAIGKDFLPNNQFFAKTPDSGGYQFSIYGVLGVLVSKKAGLEINLLGLVIGINPMKVGFAWPGVGWVYPFLKL